MRTANHVSAQWIHLIIDSLNRLDIDTRRVISHSGLDSSALHNPNAQFSEDDLTRLWKSATRITGNPAIGLTMGKNPNLGITNPIAMNLMSSATVGDAQQRLVKIQSEIGLATQCSLEQLGDGNKVVFHRSGGNLTPTYQGYDAALAMMAFSTRFCTNEEINPRYVSFVHEMPEDITPYEDIFKCEIRFEQDEYAIFFAKKDLEIPLIFSNKHLADFQDKKYEDKENEPFSKQVQAFFKKELSGGEPQVQVVAASFNLGPRTLQRRLRNEGWTYTKLLDKTRKELADLLVTKTTLSLKQVTYELGFSDHSNFYRAFKRWYGCTPGEYRRNNTMPSPAEPIQ